MSICCGVPHSHGGFTWGTTLSLERVLRSSSVCLLVPLSLSCCAASCAYMSDACLSEQIYIRPGQGRSLVHVYRCELVYRVHSSRRARWRLPRSRNRRCSLSFVGPNLYSSLKRFCFVSFELLQAACMLSWFICPCTSLGASNCGLMFEFPSGHDLYDVTFVSRHRCW